MIVVSLFDGMSCGQQAFERAGIKVEDYIASEIDKHAIKVTQANYPSTTQIGSVVDIDVETLPYTHVLIGGSPCQSFSFAGTRKGMSTKCEEEILTIEHYLKLKSEGYEFEGQSYLFWEYIRVLTGLRKVNPDIKFILENVVMTEKWEKILSKAIGVNPICLNSTLVSAQNRKRLYWTNIGMQAGGLFGYQESIIQQPKDKGILLKDILEEEVDEKYFLSEKITSRFKKKQKGKNIVGTTLGDDNTRNGERDFVYGIEHKIGCLNSTDYKQPKQIIVAMRGRTEEKGADWNSSNHIQKLESRSDGKTNALSSVQKDNLVKGTRLRKLTPRECERLQTVRDDYTDFVSDSQRYKMIGNGWTIDIIVHILSYLNKNN